MACYAPPERAMHHGVLCRGAEDQVRLFLQKPSPSEQQAAGAIDAYGQSLLDIGVMNIDAATAVALVELFGLTRREDGRLAIGGRLGEAALQYGLDLYNEICCGLGTEVTLERYVQSLRKSGSHWDEALLGRLFAALRSVPFRVRLLPRCDFLHFGASRQIISSGYALLQQDLGVASLVAPLNIGNEIAPGGQLAGANAWVEGCRIRARVDLGGENVLTGVDVDEPLALPRRACLDVLAGKDRAGREAWFVRPYGVEDTFKDTVAEGATYCGRPVLEWLRALGARPADVWGERAEVERQTLWAARLFPAVRTPTEYRQWVWMLEPEKASDEAVRRWWTADRYSLAEMSSLADLDAFFEWRGRIRAEQVLRSLRRLFRPASEFSAPELAHVLGHAPDRVDWIAAVLREAHWHAQGGGRDDLTHDSTAGKAGKMPAPPERAADPLERLSETTLAFPRIIHTLGSAVAMLEGAHDRPVSEALPGLAERLAPRERDWLEQVGLEVGNARSILKWAERAQALAFEAFGRVILASGTGRKRDWEALLAERGSHSLLPHSSLRSDEIVWGRVPARLDVGGGWTDTPPYSLERGGSVVNVAVNLNGQPPIQAYARVVPDPVIRISSIDLGAKLEIHELEQLLDYQQPESEFGLVKAALALSGLSPDAAPWHPEATLREMLEECGGGIEITTLAALPKGSGLGTSSVMGAVILAVIRRVMGRTFSQRGLFHAVLRLEQALTTGGGWQDQIGGATAGAKIITTGPGLVPDARIHYLPTDVVDPQLNGGRTLLYYTGITRLAKDILENVVGRYLDRDRQTLATLRRIGALAPQVAEAISGKDLDGFGRLVGEAWELNKKLDPDSTNPEVEELMARTRPYTLGAKLLGAGGGGFLLMVCRSETDARRLRGTLEAAPPNPRARFFDFDVSKDGLVVTVS